MTPRRLAATVAALLTVAPPAVAAPGLPLPLYTDPGNHGIVLKYHLLGPLGESGLSVEALPTMLLVRAVAPGSPAARAGVPAPDRFRVRLAAVDGVSVDELPWTALVASFGRGRAHVRVTLGRKGPNDLEEQLVGPFTLALTPAAAAQNQPSAEVTAARALLTAQQAAFAGQAELAVDLANRVPANSPLHARALEVREGAEEAQQRDLLARADLQAGHGNFGAALGTLRGVNETGSFGELRRVREQGWEAAIAARKSIHPAELRIHAPDRAHPAAPHHPVHNAQHEQPSKAERRAARRRQQEAQDDAARERRALRLRRQRHH